MSGIVSRGKNPFMGIVSGEEESVRGDSVRAAEFVGGIVSGEGQNLLAGIVSGGSESAVIPRQINTGR